MSYFCIAGEALLPVGVEIGGTFTDVVLFDEDTNSVAKAVVSLGDASL
jgi:N-methylhydantoinase A/oxoprolinase/acetone carboxylase beta subunit